MHTIRHLANFIITVYQIVVSPFLGPCCRFYPSCSAYASEAILKYGLLKGGTMACKRLLKCHPFHDGGVDPVP